MLLPQNLIKEALWKASSTGADYAEIFAEYTKQKSISMVASKVDKIADGVISGVGIRIFKGTRCVHASCSSFAPEAILAGTATPTTSPIAGVEYSATGAKENLERI